MSPAWDAALAVKKAKALPKKTVICDALLDQTIFAGLGNIIKNEILFCARIQPESTVHAIPARLLRSLVDEAHQYAYEFLHWRREGTLPKHWQAHNQKTCPRCDLPFIKAYTGLLERRSFYCAQCMKQYSSDAG